MYFEGLISIKSQKYGISVLEGIQSTLPIEMMLKSTLQLYKVKSQESCKYDELDVSNVKCEILTVVRATSMS